MSFLKRLFGGSGGGSDDKGLGEHLPYLNSLREPAIALSRSGSTTFSQIGGLPSMPGTLPWPEWKDKPLAFLCQIDLSEIPEGCDRGGLPSTGLLYFFYNQDQETWGFDPADRDSWKVIYADSASDECSERLPPKGLAREAVFNKKSIRFSGVLNYPDVQDARIDALDLSDGQFDEYIDLCSSLYGEEPAHHLLGYPEAIQGSDMDLECQLVSNGLYCGDASGYNDPRRRELESARGEWRLLMQIDSDDDAGMMWGDLGRLYFWIKEKDLEQKRFAACWMILQCS